MKKFLLIIIAFCLLIPKINSQTKDELIKKIESLNKEFSKAVLANDFDGQLKFYTEDAYLLPNYEKMMIGKKEMRLANEKVKQAPPKMLSFNLYTKDITQSGKFIVEIGTFDLSLIMPDDPEPINDEGKYVVVWEKQDDGSLKIKVDIWNTDLNPWAPMDDMPDDDK